MFVAVNRPALKLEPELPAPDLFSFTVLTSKTAGAAGATARGTAGAELCANDDAAIARKSSSAANGSFRTLRSIMEASNPPIVVLNIAEFPAILQFPHRRNLNPVGTEAQSLINWKF